ncbi:MAG: DUF423 domain-containing protein [Phenylobacterium sp.]|uniref:DUF423 domain-containing protein n=1 Tax=Phenylobacterium sp. TaxID=1871053 RepID=UPI003919E4EB
MRIWMILAALGGFLGVAGGAFGAHGVQDPQAKEWLRTGALYAMVHVLACFASLALVAAGAERARLAPALFLPGVLVFAGSLYAMALGAPRWFGAITPIGGLLFLAGWVVLAWAAFQLDQG